MTLTFLYKYVLIYLSDLDRLVCICQVSILTCYIYLCSEGDTCLWLYHENIWTNLHIWRANVGCRRVNKQSSYPRGFIRNWNRRAKREISHWFKHISFRRKGLGVAHNVTMPSPNITLGTYFTADTNIGKPSYKVYPIRHNTPQQWPIILHDVNLEYLSITCSWS